VVDDQSDFFEIDGNAWLSEEVRRHVFRRTIADFETQNSRQNMTSHGCLKAVPECSHRPAAHRIRNTGVQLSCCGYWIPTKPSWARGPVQQLTVTFPPVLTNTYVMLCCFAAPETDTVSFSVSGAESAAGAAACN